MPLYSSLRFSFGSELKDQCLYVPDGSMKYIFGAPSDSSVLN